jgi:8-oxo-dGTP pyrophosphatase MutT (NUDIX family)
VPDLEASRRVRDPKILPKHWMMVAASGVVYEDGKLLVVRDLQGFWAGVGGWIDPGESPEQAIIREMREELGVEATVTRHFRPFIAWHVAEHEHPISFLLFSHRLKLASTDFTIDPGEVTDVAWVTPEELTNLDMLPHVRTLFEDRLEEWLAL